MRVALTEPIEPIGMQILREAGHEVLVGAGHGQSAAALYDLCAQAEAVVVRQKLPEDLPARCPRLLIAARHGVGVDLIPVEACTRHGVLVTNVPGANGDAVAEYVVAQMLAAARRTQRIHDTLLAEGWAAARAMFGQARELRGGTIGIVGVGGIGQRLAEIAHHGFGMRVLGHRRNRAALPGFVTHADLAALFAQSDWVVLACPLTPETRGLASATLIGLMKPTAWLVNVSRGGTVDEPALVWALENNRIGGAILDVFADQPLAPDHRLRRLPNVLMTPHGAGLTRESSTRMSEASARDVVRVLAGEKPQHFINPEAWDANQARRRAMGA